MEWWSIWTKTHERGIVQFPLIVRPESTPNVVPVVVSTLKMSFNKQEAALKKKQLKSTTMKRLDESRLALVRLLIPPTAHRNELRVMPEHEVINLSIVALAKQALLLMTSSDPHRVAACGCRSVHQRDG